MDDVDLIKHEEELAEQLKGSRLEPLAEGVAAVVAAAPWVGGTLSAVISGRVTERKLRRVNEALLYLATKLGHISDTLNDDYIRSEEFEDLLDETLQKIARERVEGKRELYALYLRGVLTHLEESYDEKLRFLAVLDQLQVAHINVLYAFLEQPDEQRMYSDLAGAQIHTLQRRLPDFSKSLIEDLVTYLNDLRLTDARHLSTMMTSLSAENLRDRVTPFGKRFFNFLATT